MTAAPPQPPRGVITSDAGEYDLHKGKPGVAAWINQAYGESLPFNIAPFHIELWLTGQQLPAGCGEPFPRAHSSGRFSSGHTRKWVAKYLLGGSAKVDELKQQTFFDPKDELRKIAIEDKRIDLEEKKKAKSGLYMLTADAVAKCRNFAALVWAKFCRNRETDLTAWTAARLQGLLTTEKLASFMADYTAETQRQNDNLQKDFEALSKGCTDPSTQGEIMEDSK